MRRTLLVFAVALLAFFEAVPVSSQTSAQTTPQALKTAYDKAMIANDWPTALETARELVGADPKSTNLLLLANAQLHATNGNSDTGQAEACLATYDRALAAAEQEKPAQGQPNQAELDQAWKDGMAKIYIGKGNALLKLKRNAAAIDNYNQAAELSSNPGQAYFNICAVLYNNGDTVNGPNACRKAAAVDPTRANTWFVLGSLLFAEAKIDAQGKVSITNECRDALNKYLELAPAGPHAADVKAMLDMAAK